MHCGPADEFVGGGGWRGLGMSGTQLHLLGGFALEDGDARVDLPVGMQRLLAFLALKSPVNRYVVAGTLWPNVSEAHALASLRTSMWRLNRAVPDLVVSDGMGLATRGSLTIDSREQEQFTTRLLRQQVEDDRWITDHLEILWPRDLLPGWYDDWVIFDRERIGQLRLHALEHAAVVMARNHHLAAALQLALEAVRAEPLRETANAALIEVYLAEGNICDAVDQYDRFRLLSQSELGVDPSPALGSMLPPALAR